MRNLILFAPALWLVLSYVLGTTATAVSSKWMPAQKRDIMKMNMEVIRKNLGTITTMTESVNNKPTYNCQHQNGGTSPGSIPATVDIQVTSDISDVADLNEKTSQLGLSNDSSNWQMLGSSIREMKTSFSNFNARLYDLSCGNLNTPRTTTIKTTTTKTTATTTPQIITTLINNTTCSSSDFRCGDGSCIPRYWLCDGQEDCKDCSDEKNCTKAEVVCPDHLFRCNLSGPCIQREWLCDDDNDCPQGEDEEPKLCSNGIVRPSPTPSYGPGDIPCEAGGLPVPKYYRCDGTTDCDNCMDEYQCVECPVSFTAVGHQCLSIDKVKRTWKDASMHCQSLGGRLAEPRDLDALSCFMKDKQGLRARYWVGGSFLEGRWLWSGGAPVPHLLLTSSGSSSGARYLTPNNRPDTDRTCIDYMPRRTKTPFNISNCQTKFRSLCQIDYID